MSATKTRWLEIIGGVAVIVSVLLLAWEIRQNTQAMKAQSMLDLNGMANQVLISEAQNDQLAAVMVKGEVDIASLSDIEYRQFRSQTYALINAIRAAHGFHMQGILNDADFSGWREFTCPYLGGSAVNVIWGSYKPTFGEDFVQFVSDTCGL